MPSALKQLSEVFSCQLQPRNVLGDRCVFTEIDGTLSKMRHQEANEASSGGRENPAVLAHRPVLQGSQATEGAEFKSSELQAEPGWPSAHPAAPAPKDSSFHRSASPHLFLRGGGEGWGVLTLLDSSRRSDVQSFKKESNPSKHTYC